MFNKRVDDSKAGMKNIDHERINNIIEKASLQSRYHKYEERQQERIASQIKDRKSRIERFSESDLEKAKIEADCIIKSLEDSFDYSRTIVHFDLDAFYCAVEMRDNPELTNVPMAVGTLSMLCTSNYKARQFGVRAAMPGFIAQQLCPELVIIEPNMSKYCEVSHVVMSVLERYDPNYVAVSLDEAYIDLTHYKDQSINDLVERIRDEIKSITNGLTISAGIACNCLLAKLCTDVNKPNGQYI